MFDMRRVARLFAALFCLVLLAPTALGQLGSGPGEVLPPEDGEVPPIHLNYGCPCMCPQPPASYEDMYFCDAGSCDWVGHVTAASLTAWLEGHCVDLSWDESACEWDCIAEVLAYRTRLCKCEQLDWTAGECDLNADSVVNCDDLRSWLTDIGEPCIPRPLIVELICCFLSHVRPDAPDGCDQLWGAADPCTDIAECLAHIHEVDGAPDRFSPPLSPVEIAELLDCYECDCCKETPSGTKYHDCNESGPIDCDRNHDEAVDCEDLHALWDTAVLCLPPEEQAGGLTDEEKFDLACLFIADCISGDPCEFIAMVIDCLEEELCRDLTDEEVEEMVACAGEAGELCDLGTCCKEASAAPADWNGNTSVSVSYSACGGTIRCDQDCDGDSDCDDFAVFAETARTGCMGQEPEGHLTRAQLILLACAFLSEGQCAGGEACSCIATRIQDILEQNGDESPELTGDELAQLVECSACEQICDPRGGRGAPGDAPVCGAPEDSNPRDLNGVQVSIGFPTVHGSDLWMAVAGPDVEVSHDITADDSYSDACVTGESSSNSAFQWLDDQSGEDPPTLWWNHSATRSVPIDVSTGSKVTDSSTGLEFWRVPGATTMIVHKALAEYGSQTFAVWRLREPGGAATDYYRVPDSGETAATAVHSALIGLVAGVTDIHSDTVHRYEYGLWPGPGSTLVARLARIRAMTGTSIQGQLDFLYNDTDDGNPGRVKLVLGSRPDENGSLTLVQKVHYSYVGGTDLPTDASDEIGTNGDLVLVASSERVDPLPGAGGVPVWRDRITQYRYHGNASSISGTAGSAHQIKMVILPEQMEFAAAQAGATSLWSYALGSLKLDDDDVAWTGGEPLVNLASSFYKEYETGSTHRILTLLSGTGCGCSGGSGPAQRTFSYAYVASGTNWNTVSVDETPGPTSSAFRRYWYETYSPGGAGNRYLRAQAIEELDASHATTHRAWVHWYDHDSSTKRLVQERTPSTFPDGIGTGSSYDYQPGTSSGPTPPTFASSTVGLSHHYAYVGTGNLYGHKSLASVSVGEGSSPSSWTLIEDREYGDADGGGSDWSSTDTRSHLVTRVRRYRDESDTTTASLIEETRYHYGFFSSTSDDIASIQTSVESETVAENGPGVWYHSYDLFDSKGQNTWSIDAAHTVTQRTYTAPSGQYATSTGQPLKVVRNAPHTDLPSSYHGLSLTGIGDRSSDGGSLPTTYRRDLLGRVQETVQPGGVSTYTIRHMATHSSRGSLPHYVELTLPFQWDDGDLHVAGAATATWHTASGKSLATSEYLVGDVAYTMSTATSGWQLRVSDYTLGDECGRRVTTYAYNGNTLAEDTFTAFVTGADQAPFDGIITSWRHYDDLGRVEDSVSPNGTVTHYTYDVLDRVVQTAIDVVDSGGALPTSFTTVAEVHYDGSSTTVPGIGNGNLTESVAMVGASGADRATQFVYDYRDRRIKTLNPESPHEWVKYDNLDRVVERAVCSDLADDANPPADADRGVFTTRLYSQRGLPYCERIATDPTDSTPDFLETHRWYDEVGRTVGTWGPNAPASKITYDGLGRVSTSYLTDRRTDAAPGAAGNYAAVSASHAAVLTGDVVFEETSQAYDGSSGLPTLMTHRRRAHDATVSDTGTLASMTSPAPIVTYSAHYYDAALRPIRSVEYGTTHTDDILRTGGSAPGYTFGSPPAWYASDTAIITSTEYDAKGRVDSVTAPVTVDPGVEANSVARTTKFVYDLADRRIATIENFHASAPPSIAWSGTSSGGNWDVTGLAAASPDVNCTTTFVYNGVGATVRLSAWNSPDLSAAPSAQVTEYVYGVTTALGVPSELNSNDLLAEVVYPSDSFAPANFHTLYGYNLQGQTIQMAEGQPGAFGTLSSVHAYGYDDGGRLTVDQATSIDSSADGLVDALLYDYDEFGRLERALSQDGYAPPSNGTTVNAVAFTYTPLWQVEHVDQNPVGAIGTITSTSATQRVAYAYDTQPSSGGADNYSRASSITYPDGAVENLDYGGGSPGGPDDVSSRLTGLGFGSTKLVAYDHLGFGTVAQVDYPVPDIQLDRVRGHGGGSTSGQYPGFDRFGRAKRQLWVDGGFTSGSGGNPNIPPIVETLYSYDLSGNRLAALDDRPGQAQPLSHEYAYDGLNRLVEAKRGVASGGSVTANKFSQRWRDGSGNVTLDALGNWYQSWTDHAGDGYGGNTDRDFDQRSHEPMNRIATRQLAPGATTPVDLGVGSPPAFEYDYAANLKSHKEWTGSGTSTNTVEYKHDAWNRLVQVKVAGADRSLQGYNALHWRTCKVADVIGSGTGASAGPDGTIEQVRLMYYSADWQLLEERVDNAAASTTTPAKLYDGTWTTSGVDRRQQYLWGTRYIDDIVLHRIDRNADGDYTDTTDGTWYHLTDAQFSSVCLTDRSANVVERVTYSAYGVARHHWKGDVDGDGDVDTSGSSSDRGIVSGIAGQTLANRTIGGSAYRAEADLDRNGVVEVADRNLIPTAIAGRPEGQLTDTGAQGPEGQIGWQGYVFSPDYEWYLARYRTYSPQLGRWAARDSEGYPDGMSLFAFARSSPTNRNDSMGRTSEILNRVKPKQPRESEPNTAPGFVDTGTPLGPRGECKCGISREIEIDILDYGRYRDSFNEWAGRLTIGEHEVRNLQQVLDAIRSQVRSEELLVGDGCVCIKTLRIIGHGDFGTISIGAGKGGVSVEQPAPGGGTTIVQTFPSGEPEADEYLTADNVKTLREFAAYMCPDGEVVLWGCNVAKGNDGKSLLKKLAGILGVRVSAPTGEIDAFGNIYHGDWETVHP